MNAIETNQNPQKVVSLYVFPKDGRCADEDGENYPPKKFKCDREREVRKEEEKRKGGETERERGDRQRG